MTHGAHRFVESAEVENLVRVDGIFMGKGDRWQIFYSCSDENLLTIKMLYVLVSVMSFSKARMITHVQTSIVIPLLHVLVEVFWLGYMT